MEFYRQDEPTMAMALPATTSSVESNPLLLLNNDESTTTRRRSLLTAGHSQRRGKRTLSAFCFFVLVLASASDSFTPATRTFRDAKSTFIPGTQLLVSKDYTSSSKSPLSSSSSTTTSTTTSSSWSKPGTSDSDSDSSSGESRFGVRKRVKAVLEKAKNRTGLSNRNSDASVIAEAASIGGLYESADLVVRKDASTTNGASSERTNGYSNGYSNGDVVAQALREVQGRGPLRNGTDVDFVMETANGRSSSNTRVEVDAVLNSGKVEPLPFKLPKLTPAQREVLVAGERIQEQSKMGREGSGYVVVDVKAPDWVVWECLLDFEKYTEYIGTVRSMSIYTNTHLKQSYIAEKPVLPGTGRETRHYGAASITRASFVLSKFQLNIAAVHKYSPHPDGHYMEFNLDKACRNAVLKDAKGIWHTETDPDGRKGYTRIWLLCDLAVSQLLPTFIVDYAAKRAMPRASSWIKPTVLAMKKEFGIRDDDDEAVE